MNKKTKEKKDNSLKNKGKIKRQVSVFTIILWLFLIITMTTITLNSIKTRNALEVTDNNWNISLVMYDRSSDTPDESTTEYTWNAVYRSEAKQLCMQINYACTTNKGYNPGEIEITIPGFAKDSFSEINRGGNTYSNWLKNNVVIAADKQESTNKEYDWSYTYDNASNVYKFLNNFTIASNEHFEGSIQLVYNLEPKFRIKTDLGFKAKIKENIEGADEVIAMESNVCNFHYTSTKRQFTFKKNAQVSPKTDYTKIEDILDDYYWIRYFFTYESNRNILQLYGPNKNDDSFAYKNPHAVKDVFPEGCVVYNSKFEKMTLNGNSGYDFVATYKDDSSKVFYYVGYPKTKYHDGDRIDNLAEFWGRYEDETDVQKIAESSTSVTLTDFNFEYTGELYGIEKTYANPEVPLNLIKNDKAPSSWWLKPKAFYTDSKMDVEIGDDLLYITRENGEVTKLNENEYNFTSIEIPEFRTYNKFSGREGNALVGYNYQIQVKYKNSSEYVVYKEGTTAKSESVGTSYKEVIDFDRNDIIGVKIVLKDLDKTLYSGNINVSTNIYTKDCIVDGKIYNFDYIQVYKKDAAGNRTLVNEPTLDSYSTESTKFKIAEYDKNTYGTYMQRDFAIQNIVGGSCTLGCVKANENLVNNAAEKKYENDYIITSRLNIEYYDLKKDVIVKQYDILPTGVFLASSKEEILNSIKWTDDFLHVNNDKEITQIIKLKDGTTFNTKEELNNYVKNNTEIRIDYNYKNSGRTKINIIYNLNGIDWNELLINDIVGSGINATLKTDIPYDSILDYGTVYKNNTYVMWNNQEYDTSGKSIDDGTLDSLERDIDEDGDTTERVVWYTSTLNITHAVSSHQAVIKQVRTDLTKGKFIEGTAEATAGSEYTYKLRITTGANSLKDLIIYDTLETIYDEDGNDISDGWKGTLSSIDTSYAVSKGYAPVVYYSEEQNPGKLTEVPAKWKVLTDTTDKSKVKSICVDLRYNSDGTEMELSANNIVYVLINMLAPSDDTIITSANNMFSTNWRAKDPLGTVIDNVEGIYSNQVNVEIHKEDVRQNINGRKTWEDLENKYEQRPSSIIVKLLQDGKEYVTREVTAENNWSYTFENVPVYAGNTHAYTYEIIEEEVPNYETTYDGYNITNSIKLKDIEVVKVWEDNEDEAKKRPDSIILQLFDKDKLIEEVELNDENEWKHTFTNLLKYRENGEEIEYTIDEKSFENDKFYTKEIIEDDVITVTNRFVVPEDVVLIKAVKKWEDNNDEYQKRPGSVTLQVFNGDKLVTEGKVNSENDWTYEFKLPKYNELGNEIKYTIDEKETPEYYKKSIDGYVVTNKSTYKPPVNTSDINIFLYIGIFCIAIIVIIVVTIFIMNKKDKK